MGWESWQNSASSDFGLGDVGFLVEAYHDDGSAGGTPTRGGSRVTYRRSVVRAVMVKPLVSGGVSPTGWKCEVQGGGSGKILTRLSAKIT